MTSRVRLPGLLVLAALLAACGDDSEPVSPPVPPAPIPTAEPAPVAPPVEPAIVAPATPVERVVPTPAPTPPNPAPTPPEPLPDPQAAAPMEPVPAPATPAEPTPAPIPAPEPAAAPDGVGTPVLPIGTTDPAIDIDLRERIGAVDPAAATGFAAPCLICHVAEPGAAGRLGPNLYAIVGREIAGDPVFTYSPEMAALGGTGATWTFERLDAFLANPQAAVPGTRMTFAGIADPAERAGAIAWLRSLAAEPAPLAAGVRPEGRIGTATTFSAVQADAGEIAYVEETCARCHGDTLRGVVDVRGDEFGGDGPSLRSANFFNHFYGRSVADLFRYIQDRMPPAARGTLPNETVTDLIAFILRTNGFAPGEAMPADPAALEGMGFWQ